MTLSQNQSETPAIDLADVRLTLTSEAGPVNILKGIDLTIEHKETVGVVGPSGSGKTSLLMVIAGLEAASSGSIHVAGHDITTMDEDALALFRRTQVGIVFQDFHLVPTMTALENTAMPLEFAGRKDAFDLARETLDQVGLGHRLDHYPGQLSGGEQQRVALARAFAPRPAILLADEPTGNLDQDTGSRIMDLLFTLHDENDTTLMLITHEPRLAEKCARRIHVADGRIADDGRAA